MIYAKCDRCGADVDVNECTGLSLRINIRTRPQDREYDLCEKCCDAVREFIRGNDGKG